MNWIQGIQRAIDYIEANITEEIGYAENVEFEVYSSVDISDPNYHCEIWIAVNEKK